MKRLDSRGFSVIEIVLIVVVIGLIGGTGFYVFQAKKAANSTYNNAGNALTGIKPDTKKTTNPTNPTNNTQNTNTSTPSSSAPDVTMTDTDNGKTITLTKNQNLIVQLTSTYWTIHDSSNTNVIKMVGQPEIKATGTPGVGNGTATAHFTALGNGTATISADRTSCGEGRTCTGSQGIYQITVVVK